MCSALVIPGLGQILNQQLKKGVCILGAVFVLFLCGVYKLFQVAFGHSGHMENRLEPQSVIDKLGGADAFTLWLVLGAFGMLWIYAVFDACLVGLRIDRDQPSEGDTR